MKKIAWLSLVLAALAVGCGSSTPALRSGNISLTWSLSDKNTGNPVSCAPGDKVVVTAVPLGGGTTFVDRFDCTLLGGTTDNLTGGDYTATVQLVDANGAAVTQAVTFASTVHIDGTIVDIGHWILQV
jgi:hypothetical protein